jgi:hypothetical protein
MPVHPDRPSGPPEDAEPTPRPVGEGEPAEDSVRSRAAAEAARRKRRAVVFGDVLPVGTSDERGDAWGDPAGGSDSGNHASGSNDEWLRRQVPPHHG